MEKITSAYYYLFYKFYKFGFDSGPFSRNFSATILLVILETAFVISLNCYYIDFFDKRGELQLYSLKIIIPLLVVFYLNNSMFISNDKWKDYIQEFDKWPKYKNIIGSFITVIIVGLAIYSIQYSLSTMHQINANRQINFYKH